MKISRVEEYKLYLRLVLSEEVKDKKKLEILVEQFYLAFCDGIRFGKGNLVIEDD